MRNTSLLLTPIFVEKRKKQRNVAKVHHLSSTTRTHTKRKKEKGILVKLIAQPNPKLNLSKCVASWTQNNYIITRAFFHQVVVTLKFTPIKKLSITFVSCSSQSSQNSTSQALTKCNYESTYKSLQRRVSNFFMPQLKNH